MDAREAVKAAIEHRGSIQSARLKVQEAEHDRDAAGAYPLTRLETAIPTFPEANPGEDLSLFQPLDIFGKFRAAGRQGQALVGAARAALRQAALDVQEQTLTTYAQFLSTQRLLVTANEQRDMANQLAVIAHKRVAARDLAEVEGTRADIELEKATQQVVDRQAAVDAAKARLEAALGFSPPLPADQMVASIPTELVQTTDLSTHLPELQSISADVAEARAEATQAKLSQLPDTELQLRRSPWSEPEFYGAALAFVIPIWDHGAANSRLKSADRKKDAAEALFSDRLLAAQKELQASHIELAAAVNAVAAYGKLVEATRSLLAKTQKGFELGAISLIEVLDARKALSDAQELLIGANLRQDLAVEAVLRAQGQLLEEPEAMSKGGKK